MNTALKQRRVVDKILTKVAMGYALDQEFSGHHLFPDVDVTEMGGKIIKFGKEAYIVQNTKRAPGETVRSIGISYSADDYVLANRLLNAKCPEEFLEEMNKIPSIAARTRAVNVVMHKMRLEGEFDKAALATNPSNYTPGHTLALSGTSQWSNPAADAGTQMEDAKSVVRAKIGREPNVLHLDYKGYKGLKRNEDIRKSCLPQGKGSVTIAHLAEYFDVEKVVVGKAVRAVDLDSPFIDVWQDNSMLAYVPPKALQSKESPSFGYNYVHEGFPKVEKEYFEKSDRSWHNPVLFRDKAIITDPSAGFLFQNTTA